MDEIEITLGGGVYRLRPMPARLYLGVLRKTVTDADLMEAVDAACLAHPHGDGPLLEADISPGALRRLAREWVRISQDDPYPPAEGRS
jgi:hypothetical protein